MLWQREHTTRDFLSTKWLRRINIIVYTSNLCDQLHLKYPLLRMKRKSNEGWSDDFAKGSFITLFITWLSNCCTRNDNPFCCAAAATCCMTFLNECVVDLTWNWCWHAPSLSFAERAPTKTTCIGKHLYTLAKLNPSGKSFECSFLHYIDCIIFEGFIHNFATFKIFTEHVFSCEVHTYLQAFLQSQYKHLFEHIAISNWTLWGCWECTWLSYRKFHTLRSETFNYKVGLCGLCGGSSAYCKYSGLSCITVLKQ